MLKYLLKQTWYLVFILVLIIAEPAMNSVLNFLLQSIFNAVEPGADKLFILQLLTYGFLLWIVKRVISFSSGVVKNRFICNAKQEIKHKLFVRLLGLDTSNLSAIASSGEYISLFTNDISLLETRFFNQIVGLVSAIFSIVIMGSAFFALNLKLAGAILAFGVLTMFVPAVFSKKLNEKNLVYSETIARFTQRMKEYMISYPTIKNYSIEREIGDRFNAINKETEDAKFEADYSLTLANGVGQLLSWFMQFIGLGFGIMLVVKGEILIGTVISAQSFASDLANPLQDILININSIRSVRDIVKKINKLSGEEDEKAKAKALPAGDAPAELAEEETAASAELTENSADLAASAELPMEGGPPLALPPPAELCDIEFRDFTLAIEEKNIIDGFSFTFETGKKYLVIGLNGSGKSTLFKSLKKWYRPTSGCILVNGKDVRTLENEELSKQISYLNENVSLFSGSVRENILLFREFSEENFNRAIEEAKIEIGLDREVRDEGVNISSGEQRRIEIARSLLGAVRALIFDEVVSTLDIETAYEIEKLALGFKDKTVIFISHNFSGKLIRAYDEILVMHGGKLLAHGSYGELMESCDYFRRICDIKFGA